MNENEDKEVGEEELEAEHRLHDILPEEVSYVDHAANRRRFLVVKNQQKAGGKNMGAENNQPAEKKGPIPTPVKEGILRVLTEVLERGVSLTNMIKEAEETADQMEAPLPSEYATEMKALAELLTGALGRYPSPVSGSANQTDKKDDGPEPKPAEQAAKGLGVKFADLAKQLAELSTQIESSEKVTAEEAEKVHSFMSDFAGVVDEVGAKPEPQNPEPDPEPKGDSEEDIEKRGHRFAGRRLNQFKDAMKALNDAMSAFAKILDGVEPSEEVESQDKGKKGKQADEKNKRIEEQTPQPPERKEGTELGNVGGGATGDGKQADNEPNPEMAKLMKRNEELAQRIAKLEAIPTAPASRPEDKPSDKDNPDNERTRPGTRQGGPWVW